MGTPSRCARSPAPAPTCAHLLDQDVVIAGDTARGPTGAQAIEPTHSPRTPHKAGELPAAVLAACGGADLQREVEQLLYRQAELLDAKQWQAWMDLFADDGIYWMPARAEQTEWESSPSIFIEDKLMMEIRKGRVTHPNAWSQAPLWETNHIVSHVALESVRGQPHHGALALSHDGAAARHRSATSAAATGTRWCAHADGALRIQLQRVDLFNAQAPFDYVIQIWV